MRFVEYSKERRPLERTPERDSRLAEWLTVEIEDGFSARQPQDSAWDEALRQYYGVPKNPVEDSPIEAAPNHEVVLGAISTDKLYADAIDLIFTLQQTITVRPTHRGERADADAASLQRRVNLGVSHEWQLRPAAEQAILDDIQLGTGIYYIPDTDRVVKTDIMRVTERGPRVFPIQVEDFLVPGGAIYDLQRTAWAGHRTWMTPSELNSEARRSEWDVEGFIPVAGRGWVHTARERLGRTRNANRIAERFEVLRVNAYFDYDNDGFDEDLLVVFDRSSHRIGRVIYNPLDTRPYEAMRYQLRGGLFYGLGVMEMAQQGQAVATDLMRHAIVNVWLANSRFWKGKEGIVPEDMLITPNRVKALQNPREDLIPEQMGDVYPSLAQYMAMNITITERRVGVSLEATPRPSQVLGGRTPGITALSFLQQQNRRFTPAFDGIRLGTAGAVRQCLFREQEALLDPRRSRHVTDYLQRLLGFEDAERVIRLMRDEDFDRQMSVELTASSASVNREADRQGALMLVGVLSGYYNQVLQLVQISANPELPGEVRETAKKIADAGGAIIERTIRQFDQIRDPETFIVDIETEIDSLQGRLPAGGLGGLLSLLGSAGVPVGANGGLTA